MIDMAELNLKERAEFINKRFDADITSVAKLKRIYRIYGIKKKLTLVRKGNSRKYPPEEIDRLTAKTCKEVERRLRKGYEIF